MAYGGSDSDKALTPHFFKLSGEPIPLKVPPSSEVCEVKHALAKILDVKGTLRLIDDTGKVLEANDMVAGDVQVQVMGIADGIWLKLFSAAFQGFDEEKLCKSITAAWPGDFNRRSPAPADHEDLELMDWQKEVFKQLQPVITSSCGQWADYWTFGSSADSYGYNYIRPPYPTLQATIKLFVNDVKRWQKILLELEDEFAHLRSRCSGYPLCEHLEVAIAALLRHSPRQCTDVSWHVGFEMWYQPFSQLVSWYLSSVGLEDSDIDVLKSVSNAITGFRSYQCPRDAAVVVARKVANQFHLDFNRVDSTADWLKIRSTLSALGTLSERAPTCPDTHLHFIEAVDAARSPERAQRMKHALAACRNAAKGGNPLSYDHLKNWQTHLMGANAGHIRGYRVHDAYAKQGRERYPRYSESSEDEERFIKILEEANTTEPVALRATRAYLDVLFFHPFDDGCSRLARLVFDFVLTQAHVAVNGVEVIFLFAKSARDAEGAQRLVELVEKQMAKPQFKELEDPPQIRTKFSEADGDFKWFSCEAFPADRQAF